MLQKFSGEGLGFRGHGIPPFPESPPQKTQVTRRGSLSESQPPQAPPQLLVWGDWDIWLHAYIHIYIHASILHMYTVMSIYLS